MTDSELIDELIKEDRDATIADYLAVRAEIAAIEEATKKLAA